MLGLVLAELAILAAMWATFVVAHSRSGWWRHPDGRPNWVGRQLMAMAVVGMGEAVSLFLLGSGHGPPLWVFAAGFGATDVVMGGWLLLLWRARREEER